MSTPGARFQTKTRGSEGRLFSRRCHPLEATKALLPYVQGVCEKRREHGQDEVKLMFIGVKNAHFNSKYDEE